MANLVPNRWKYELYKAVSGHTFKMSLHTGAIPTDKTLNVYGDLTNEVANGNGYTTGGVTLSGITASEDDTNHEGRFTFTAPTWPNSTISATWGAIYDTSTTPANALVELVDFGGTISSTNDTFTVTPPANGVQALV